MSSSITFDVSDELAAELDPLSDQLSHILELGLRKIRAEEQLAFSGAAEVYEFLAGLPSQLKGV